MSRILVTGASGFVGRAVVEALAERGDALRAAMRRPPGFAFGDRVEVVVHPDLAEACDWQPLLEGVDRVIHLAGIADIGRGTAAALFDTINRQATARLAAAAARAGVAHFVFVSSIRAQHGPAADHVLTERDAPTPVDAYGRSKLAAEAEVRSCGVPFTILRPVLLYGREAKGNFALLLRAAQSRWPLPVKNFVNRRSLLGIDNFVSALAFVLSGSTATGATYVVADPGIPPRLVDVFVTLREAQGRRRCLLPVPTRYLEIALRRMRRADLWERLGGDLRVDPGKLIAAGWRPAHDTRDGLAALVRVARPQSRATPASPFR